MVVALTFITILVFGVATLFLGRILLILNGIVSIEEVFDRSRGEWPRFLLFIAVMLMMPIRTEAPALAGMMLGAQMLLADLLFVAIMRYVNQANNR